MTLMLWVWTWHMLSYSSNFWDQIASYFFFANSFYFSYSVFLCTKQGLYCNALLSLLWKSLTGLRKPQTWTHWTALRLNWCLNGSKALHPYSNILERPSQTNRSCYSSEGRGYFYNSNVRCSIQVCVHWNYWNLAKLRDRFKKLIY